MRFHTYIHTYRHTEPLLEVQADLKMSKFLIQVFLQDIMSTNFLLDEGGTDDFKVLSFLNPQRFLLIKFIQTVVTESPDLLNDKYFWVVNVSSEENFMREMEVDNIDLPINSNILIASGKMNSTIRMSECYRPHPTLDIRLELSNKGMT